VLDGSVSTPSFVLVSTGEKGETTDRVAIHSELVCIQKDQTLTMNGIMFTFENQASCMLVWSALSMVMRNCFLIELPTFENMELLSTYLSSCAPFMNQLILYHLLRPDWLSHFFKLFSEAEKYSRFHQLHGFYRIMIAIFRMLGTDHVSSTFLAVLISPSYMEYTVGCLEYDQPTTSLQTRHRCFLRTTTYHTLSFSKDIKQQLESYARENYNLSYLQTLTSSLAVSQRYEDNQYRIVNIITQKNTIRQLIGLIIPFMASLNNKMIFISKPDENALLFLKELFLLKISQKAMNRLFRKLYDQSLYDVLDYAFSVSTAQLQDTVMTLLIDLFTMLSDLDHERMHEFMCHHETKLIPNMMTHLIKNTHYNHEHTDHIINFLEFVTRPDPMTQHNVMDVIEPYLHSLLTAQHEHSHKNYHFLLHVFQTYPVLFSSHANSCVSLFIKQAERFFARPSTPLEKITLSEMARVVTLHSGYLLQRTGVAESIMSVLLANQGRDNMVGSVMQVMIGNIVTQWMTSFVATQARHAVTRLPGDALQRSLAQVATAVYHALKGFQKEKAKDSKPLFIRCNTFELPIAARTTHTALAVEDSKGSNEVVANKRMALQCMAHFTTMMVKRLKTAALSRLRKNAFKEDNNLLMDAVYILAYKRKMEHRASMAFVLKKMLLPLIKRSYLRTFFQKWKSGNKKRVVCTRETPWFILNGLIWKPTVKAVTVVEAVSIIPDRLPSAKKSARKMICFI
jgi:uncharacterized protein YejL (UPF0352 family)